jgi:hypothetical protein
VEVISAYRRDNGDPPAAMLAVWDYEHKNLMHDAARTKAIIDMLRR